MTWQWNGKQDVTVMLVLIFAVPAIAGIVAIVFSTVIPFAGNHPVLFWVLWTLLFIAGVVIVYNSVNKRKDKTPKG